MQPTSSGARIRSANGKLVKTDGPFSESKEVIGGFSIINVASRDEAIAQGLKFMDLHRIHWPTWEGELEIRLMYGAEDDVQATQLEGSRVSEQGAVTK
ncbi:MAG TPA: YciI family protein [Gemmatimonadaceae bacterium]|nr:YciI family protein [Gemmatimonadaceae bacterium]